MNRLGGDAYKREMPATAKKQVHGGSAVLRAREPARRKKDSLQFRIPAPARAGQRGALQVEVGVQFQTLTLVFQEDGLNSQSAHEGSTIGNKQKCLALKRLSLN